MLVSKRFTLIAFLFFFLVFLIENLNGAFELNDFKVYYGASNDFIQGKNPYTQAYGLSSGFYKYSPATLLFFAPANLLGLETAKIIHFALIAIFCIGALHLSLKFSKLYLPGAPIKETLFLSLLLIFSAVHLSRELHLGNINFVLIFLTLASFQLVLENKNWWAAILFSCLFLLKPYFLILILIIMVRRDFVLLLRIIFIIGIISALPVIFIGFEKTVEFNQNWLGAMSGHTEAMASDHTFISITKAYTGLELASYWQFVFILLTGIVFLISRAAYFMKSKYYSNDLIISDCFILLAVIPNLVITDSQHFLFTIPLISLILIHIFRNPNWKLIAVFAVLFFFYGMNSNDLLGNPLSDGFDRYSTIGVANLLMIMLLIYLRKARKSNATSSSVASP